MEAHYPEIFIISYSTAQKLNIYGFPVQLYVDKKGIIKHYEMGGSFELSHKKLDMVTKFFSS
ncbi:MAG: hypothetical protein RIC95_06755 [Vicingaceae bacterium]